MATLEEFIAEELTAIKAGETIYKSSNGVKKPMTDEDLENIANTRGNIKFDQQENGYKYARETAYLELKEQLDMQYKDLVDGTTTWKDHVAKVKSDNPKPE